MDVHPDVARYAAMAGFDAAYLVLTDPARQQAMLSDPDTPPAPAWRWPRLRGGLAPDDPAAHFDLATAALLAGHPNEAAAATADCADSAAPYEKRDFTRRLGALMAERPDLAALARTRPHPQRRTAASHIRRHALDARPSGRNSGLGLREAARIAGHDSPGCPRNAGNAWPQPPSSMGWHPNRMSDFFAGRERCGSAGGRPGLRSRMRGPAGRGTMPLSGATGPPRSPHARGDPAALRVAVRFWEQEWERPGAQGRGKARRDAVPGNVKAAGLQLTWQLIWLIARSSAASRGAVSRLAWVSSNPPCRAARVPSAS